MSVSRTPRDSAGTSPLPPKRPMGRPRGPKPVPKVTAAGLPMDSTKGRPRPNTTTKPIIVKMEGKMAALISGELTVGDMSNEELARMQFRDKNGGFSGRPPANIPRVLVNAMRAELYARMDQKLAAGLEGAYATLLAISQNPEVKESDRIKAAGMVIEHLRGKPKERVELSTGENPFEINMSAIVRKARTRGEE